MMITTKQATEEIKKIQGDIKPKISLGFEKERTPEEIEKIKDFQKELKKDSKKLEVKEEEIVEEVAAEKPKREITISELEELTTLRPLDLDKRVNELSEETGNKPGAIKAEVKLLIKEEERRNQEIEKENEKDEKEKKKRIKKAQEELRKQSNGDKIKIELPNNGKLISTFANELVDCLANKEHLFYRSDTKSIIEIGKIRHSTGEISYKGFVDMAANRFVTLIEKHFNPWAEVFEKGGYSKKITKSMPTSTASIVLASDNFRDKLPVINRMFTVPIPIMYEGELTFPKKGYDKRFGSWLPHDAPEIIKPNMEVEKAKEIIKVLLGEFCFQSKQDYVNAISALLTPFLRGLFEEFNNRTPFNIYEANRERAGKDYCAGCTGILYEGEALEEAPISNNERSTGRNDELAKVILAALKQGRKRLHFANNKGYLNNAVLEAILTAKNFSGRILGKNELLTLVNELDISGSGNVGLTLTPDLANRSRFIKFHLEVEDANSRLFKNPNLHGWLKENRGVVLSALYSLVRNWIEKGKPKGSLPFTSYPEWAEICGGIMECAELGNPCVQDENISGVAIDTETADMKALFEYCFMKAENKYLSKKEIIVMVQECQTTEEEEDLFAHIDWEKRGDQTKFGLMLIKYVDRFLSEIKLTVENRKERTARWKYKFTKSKEAYNHKDIFEPTINSKGEIPDGI